MNSADLSDPWELCFGDLSVRILPVRQDNYAYLLIHGHKAVAVDPGEAGPLWRFVQDRGLNLSAIWVTHLHRDHVEGVAELAGLTGARVVGPAGSNLWPGQRQVTEGDRFSWGGCDVEVWYTPGHHPQHVTYLLRTASHTLAFVGDILMGAGCGRLFGNPPAQMWSSVQRLDTLPGNTMLFCGHELTLPNVAFALSLDPKDPAVVERHRREKNRREQGLPTVPLTLSEERRTNPFLRAADPAWRARIGFPGVGALDLFATLRKLKDNF